MNGIRPRLRSKPMSSSHAPGESADLHRSVFYISDRTGLTVETLGGSLLTQFTNLRFDQQTLGFVSDLAKVNTVIAQIDAAFERTGLPPLVFSTLADDDLRVRLEQCRGVCMDLFDAFIKPMEEMLGTKSLHSDAGSAHRIEDYARYQARMDALNFAQQADDGLGAKKYEKADVILVGVSRCGKTPTCLYMAMTYGIAAANYPITPEDQETLALPKALTPYREKLYGLSIDPEQLRLIRTERRPNSRYAAQETCERETRWAEGLFRRERIRCLNTTSVSIEEIAATILGDLGLDRIPL